MNASIQRTAILLAFLAAWVPLSWLITPKALPPDQNFSLAQAVPERFGTWQIDPTIVPLSPNPQTQAVLDEIYSQTLSRTYVNDKGERMMLSISYGNKQTTRLKAHRQEVCYSAQGFQISGLHGDQIQVGSRGIQATRLVATKNGRIEPITYWFTIGRSVVQGHFKRLLIQIQFALNGEIPDGMLVRVSSIDAESQRAYDAQLAFLNQLTKFLPADAQDRILGRDENRP
jgi:EpsI family protein